MESEVKFFICFKLIRAYNFWLFIHHGKEAFHPIHLDVYLQLFLKGEQKEHA